MVRAEGPSWRTWRRAIACCASSPQASGGDYRYEDLPRLAIRPPREVRVGRPATGRALVEPAAAAHRPRAADARVDAAPPRRSRLRRGRAAAHRIGQRAWHQAPAQPRGRRARPTNSISIASDGSSPAAPNAPDAIVHPTPPDIAPTPSALAGRRREDGERGDRGVPDAVGGGDGDGLLPVDAGEVPLVGSLAAVAVSPCGATVIVTLVSSQSSCASTFTVKSWPIRCRRRA